MSINLSKLNISLDKFNAESSGTYNIGQIKLSSDGKSVYRTNNHKTWTIFNSTKISPEEALAVKFAFCKALKKEGLSEEEVQKVKTKLGIPADALGALKAGNIKPLTAAEVREVIDTYAATINANRAGNPNAANVKGGVKVLKTSSELYKGVSKTEMADRATTRNAINADTIKQVVTAADKAVNNMLDILQPGSQGGTTDKATLKLAREIMTRLGDPSAFTGKKKSIVMTTAPVKFTIQENGNIAAQIILGNKNGFSIDTGLNREGLASKAADLINANIPLAISQAKKPIVEINNKDDDVLQAINEIEAGDNTSTEGAMTKEQLLQGLKEVFNALEHAVGVDSRRALRKANLEAVVTELLKALNKARPLDNKNTDLINQVREVFYGNKRINTDDLLKEISDVLNKKVVNPKEKTLNAIDNQLADELDENLNINAWLGEGAE